MKNLLFKEWLISERQTGYLMQTAQQVTSSLKKLYSPNIFNEDAVKQIPQDFFSDERLTTWIKKFNPEFTPGDHNIQKCGMEGCALFIGNKYVVKFTKGKDEANIAYLMRGDRSFPVVDVINYNNTYLIAMKELNTNFKAVEQEISDATYLIYQFISDLEDENQDKSKVPVNFNLKEFKNWMAGRPENALTLDFAYQIIKLMEKVFKKSGYSLGHDWTYDNLGMNQKGKIQPFDFGQSRTYRTNVKTPEIPSLEQ